VLADGDRAKHCHRHQHIHVEGKRAQRTKCFWNYEPSTRDDGEEKSGIRLPTVLEPRPLQQQADRCGDAGGGNKDRVR
jgi:hypothetical protein